MKKLLFFFCLTALLFSFKSNFAQTSTLTFSPQTQCYSFNGNSGAVFASVPSAVNYSWMISSPSGGSATITASTFSSQIAFMNFTGCGIFTVTCYAFSTSTLVAILNQTTSITCSNFITASPYPSSGVLCGGSGGLAIASGAQTYTWSPGGSNSSSIAVSPTANACYIVFGTSSAGCTDSASVCFTVGQTPSLTVIASNDSICSGSSATLTASGASSYSWLPGGGTGSTKVVNPTSNTIYTVIGTNSSGCTTTRTISIHVMYGPAVGLSGNILCSAGPTTLTLGGAASYTWSQGNTVSSTLAVTPTANTCYNFTATGYNGCKSWTAACVYITPLNISVSGNSVVCQYGNATLTASGASNYTWQPGNYTGSSIITYSLASTTCFTVAGSNGSGCTGTAVKCISVTTSPNSLTVTGPGTVCAGSSATLSATGANTYSWYIGSTLVYTGSTIAFTPSTTTCFTVMGLNSCGNYINGYACVGVSSALSISGNTAICSGQSTTLTASGATSYTWQPGNLTGSSIVVSPTATTCYTLYGNSSGCNSNAVSKCVNVNGPPTISISGNSTVCQYGWVALTASGASSYTWQPGNLTGSSITPYLSINTCFTVTGSNGLGCSGTAIQCLTVTPNPTLTLVGNSTVCAGTSATYAVSGANSYTWWVGNSTYTGSAVVITPSVTTCFSVVGVNSFGCVGSNGLCINVSNGSMSITGNAGICSGQSTTLTAGGATNYTWQPGSLTGASIVISPTATTCYTVYGSGSSCNGYAVRCVTVNANPSIYTASNFFCAGYAGTLSAFGASTYTWQPFNLTGANIVITPSVGGCYTVTGTSTGGCTNSAVGCYSVLTSPSITISGNNVNCSGQSTTLTASGATSYYWSPGGYTTTSIVVSPTASVCYTVYGNYYGCTGAAIRCMSVLPVPAVTALSTSSSICSGSSATLLASGAQTYTWIPGNLTGAVVVVSPSVSTCYTLVGANSNGCIGVTNLCLQVRAKPTLTVSGGIFCPGGTAVLTAQGASTYTWLPFNLTGSMVTVTPSASTCYSVIGTNTANCTNVASNCFSVLPGLNITLSGNSSVCAGKATTLTASGATTYTWMPGNISGANSVVSPSVNTCYTVIGYNTNGCTGSAVKCITVQPTPLVNVSGNNVICAGTSANLLVSGANTYTWNNGSNSPLISVSPTVSTCYTVSGSNSFGCIGTSVKCISVQPAPVINVSSPGTVCAGSPAFLLATGATTYSWSTGATSPSIQVTPLYNTTYTVTGTSSFGCTSTKTVMVGVSPGPNIYAFTSDSMICAGDSIILTAIGANSYTWSNGATGPSIFVSPSSSTAYTVTGSTNGCKNSATVFVLVSTCTGLEKNAKAETGIAFFPNPNSGRLTFTSNDSHKINYSIYDLIGREITKGEFTGTKNVDLSTCNNGTYIIRFETNSTTFYKKLILEK
jgi:hypothetical protein